MQELQCLHSARFLMLVDICMKFHDASLYGFKVIERTRWRQDFVRDKIQREIEPHTGHMWDKPSSAWGCVRWFSQGTPVLPNLPIYSSLWVKSKKKREIPQKILMQELPFLYTARRLMLVDICMKFHDASLYGF